VRNISLCESGQHPRFGATRKGYMAIWNFGIALQSAANFGSRLFELLPPVLACTSWLEMHRNTRKQARRNKRKIHKA